MLFCRSVYSGVLRLVQYTVQSAFFLCRFLGDDDRQVLTMHTMFVIIDYDTRFHSIRFEFSNLTAHGNERFEMYIIFFESKNPQDVGHPNASFLPALSRTSKLHLKYKSERHLLFGIAFKMDGPSHNLPFSPQYFSSFSETLQLVTFPLSKGAIGSCLYSRKKVYDLFLVFTLISHIIPDVLCVYCG